MIENCKECTCFRIPQSCFEAKQVHSRTPREHKTEYVPGPDCPVNLLEEDRRNWYLLLAAIAKIDPDWAKDTDGEEPDPTDPAFQEQYDPWEGLRAIEKALKGGQQ